MVACLGVAPFTGAWIEIYQPDRGYYVSQVAPFTGAWIEIEYLNKLAAGLGSLPSRERGLKSRGHVARIQSD